MTTEMTFFDTSIFIYALECDDPRARALFEEACRSGPVGTSVLTITEYCAGCYKAGRDDMAERFLAFLRDLRFEVQPIDEETAREAAGIRARCPSFKSMDALHLASAAAAGAAVFYTNDKQLRQFRDGRLEVRMMDECE